MIKNNLQGNYESNVNRRTNLVGTFSSFSVAQELLTMNLSQNTWGQKEEKMKRQITTLEN